MIFLIGCQTDDGVIRTDVHTGSQGVEFEFMPNLPPARLMSGEEAYVAVKTINKGAYDVDGIVKLTGDPGYLIFEDGLTSTQQITELEGKTNFDPIDYEQVFRFFVNTGFPDKGFSEHDSTILFSICYNYDNVFTGEICVDPDVFDEYSTDKSCTSKTKAYSGQGGPVGVSSLQTRMIKKEEGLYPQFKFTLSNFGQGQVIDPDRVEDFCSSENIERKSINSIEIKSFKFQDITLEDMNCYPDDIVFKNKLAEITCTLKDGSGKRLPLDIAEYTSSVSIEFEYGYTNSKSKIITIVNR